MDMSCNFLDVFHHMTRICGFLGHISGRQVRALCMIVRKTSWCNISLGSQSLGRRERSVNICFQTLESWNLLTYSRWTNYSNAETMSCKQPLIPSNFKVIIPYLCSCSQGLIYFVHSKEPRTLKKKHGNLGVRGFLDYKGLNNSSIDRIYPSSIFKSLTRERAKTNKTHDRQISRTWGIFQQATRRTSQILNYCG